MNEKALRQFSYLSSLLAGMEFDSLDAVAAASLLVLSSRP